MPNGATGVPIPTDEPIEETKIAMREKHIRHRLLVMRSKDKDAAAQIEESYHAKMTVIDKERHHAIAMMACNQKIWAQINSYYNQKLLELMESVEQQLTTLEESKPNKSAAKDPNQKYRRQLPKHAVKLLETWYNSHLKNPYPSKELTLSMSQKGGITVEQIRKWFANKRNRSKVNKEKMRELEVEPEVPSEPTTPAASV